MNSHPILNPNVDCPSEAHVDAPAEETRDTKPDPAGGKQAGARKIAFALALVFCLSPYASPPIALALGFAVALLVGHPYLHLNHKVTRVLLQTSVVGLGFGMSLGQVAAAGRTGFTFTVASIAGTFVFGTLLGRWVKVDHVTSRLITAGTAICGGSAIAAVGPVLDADEKQMSVSLGTIFVLNSIALFLFPLLGHGLGLTPTQFGVWAAIAIHDTSSVVGAADRFGGGALGIATTVKLARALWIVPVALAFSWGTRRATRRVAFPYFILLFVLATVAGTYLPLPKTLLHGLTALAKTGLTLTLFLIGCGLSWERIRAVGWRPLIQGVLLWLAISAGGLWVVERTL